MSLLQRPWAGAVLIVAAVFLAWSNSFTAPFHLDDHGSIITNESIRRLWPSDWLSPPATGGETVSGRPVLNFSFALNHAVGGLEVRGYHLLNLLIHTAAALVLWGILRRTPAAGGVGLALVVALLWALHPLQTAAVTYVVQRAESLAGFWVLLTLYGFVRGATGGGRGWFVLAVTSALLGVGTKETAVVVPLVVLLYDRAFLAGSFRAAWQARTTMHAALFATWLPLAVLVWTNHGRGGSAGTDTIGAGMYFLTQCEAIVHYLRLVIWPTGQVFDSGMGVVGGIGEVAPQFLLLLALAAGALWLLGRNHPAGFAGACFFLLLAPSSSFVPVATQTMAEHRMYLALAVPIVLTVAVVAAGLRRVSAARGWVGAIAVVAVVALGTLAFARNQVYASELTLWSDTVAKRPGNPRAQYNLGLALTQAGRPADAAAAFKRTLALNPQHAYAHFELGKAALMTGRWPEAAESFAAAFAADPSFVDARVNLARALVRGNRLDEAGAHYRQALTDEPGAVDIRLELAELLIAQGQGREGEALLRAALERDAGSVDGWFALGNLLAEQQRFAAAIEAYGAVLTQSPGHHDARANLANCLLFTGRIEEAITHYQTVLRARPNDTQTRENLNVARELQRRR